MGPFSTWLPRGRGERAFPEYPPSGVPGQTRNGRHGRGPHQATRVPNISTNIKTNPTTQRQSVRTIEVRQSEGDLRGRHRQHPDRRRAVIYDEGVPRPAATPPDLHPALLSGRGRERKGTSSYDQKRRRDPPPPPRHKDPVGAHRVGGRHATASPVSGSGSGTAGPVGLQSDEARRRGHVVFFAVCRAWGGGGGMGMGTGRARPPALPRCRLALCGRAGRLFGLVRHPGAAAAVAEARRGARRCVLSQQLLPGGGGGATRNRRGDPLGGRAGYDFGGGPPFSSPPPPPKVPIVTKRHDIRHKTHPRSLLGVTTFSELRSSHDGTLQIL